MKKSKSKISLRDKIANEYEDFPLLFPLLFMDPEDYDKAIIGVAKCKGRSIAVAYDYDKVIKVNMSMGMTEEAAVEYFDYNQGDAYVGEHTPVFVHKLNKE